MPEGAKSNKKNVPCLILFNFPLEFPRFFDRKKPAINLLLPKEPFFESPPPAPAPPVVPPPTFMEEVEVVFVFLVGGKNKQISEKTEVFFFGGDGHFIGARWMIF